MCRVQSLKSAPKSIIIPRRFVLSTRRNLNKLWSELEDLYVGKTSSSLLVLPELHEHENVEEQNRINEEREMLMKINF